MILRSPPISLAILISLSQHRLVTWQGECVSSKPSLTAVFQTFIQFFLMLHYYQLLLSCLKSLQLGCGKENDFTFVLQLVLMHHEVHSILGRLWETFSIPPPFLSLHLVLLGFLVSNLKSLSSSCENALNTSTCSWSTWHCLVSTWGLMVTSIRVIARLPFNMVLWMRQMNACSGLCWMTPRRKWPPVAD